MIDHFVHTFLIEHNIQDTFLDYHHNLKKQFTSFLYEIGLLVMIRFFCTILNTSELFSNHLKSNAIPCF